MKLARPRSLKPLLRRLLHLLGGDDDVFYRALTSVPFSAGLAVVGVVLIGLLVLLFEYVIPLPSEVSTVELVKVLTIVVAIAWLFIWYVLLKVTTPGHRLAITGVGLLSVGSVLAFVALPSHESTNTVSGAVAVLPPAPGKPGAGFEIGLSSRLNRCNPNVNVKLVVNGSQQYWSNFTRTARPAEYERFVIVLPGRYGRLKYGLGRRDSYPINDPEQVQIVHDKSVQRDVWLREYEKGTGKRNLTVLAGHVRDWPRFQRPVVIETSAAWISRKDVNDCNLQVPALAGAASAASLVEAEPCEYLNRHYLPKACTDPPGEAGTANMTLNPGLQVSKAVSLVSGTPLSDAGSQPPPAEIDGSRGWECRTPVSTVGSQASGGNETGTGSASASLVDQSDCHATATVESSTWHRDFLIVLIGALIGVGIHMLFQSMVEPGEPGEKRPAPAS